MIESVNGKAFKNFQEFVTMVKNNQEKYLLLENENGVKIAISQKDSQSSQERILRRYSIQKSESF